MKRLKNDFKKMLNGLAYQNANDFLSRKEKMLVLDGNGTKKIKNNVVNLEVPVHEDEILNTTELEKTAA